MSSKTLNPLGLNLTEYVQAVYSETEISTLYVLTYISKTKGRRRSHVHRNSVHYGVLGNSNSQLPPCCVENTASNLIYYLYQPSWKERLKRQQECSDSNGGKKRFTICSQQPWLRKTASFFGGFITISCFFTLANLPLVLQACRLQHDCLLLSKHVFPGKQDPPHFCFLTVCSTHASSMVSNVSSWEGQAHPSQGEPRLLGCHDSLLKSARDRALMGYKGQPRHRFYFSTETTTSTTPCSEL